MARAARAALLAIGLILGIARPAVAQQLAPTRFAPVEAPALSLPSALPSIDVPRLCEDSALRNMAEGALAGAVMTTLLVIALSPVLAVMSVGSRGRVPVGAMIGGGAAAGAVFALVARHRRCADALDASLGT